MKKRYNHWPVLVLGMFLLAPAAQAQESDAAVRTKLMNELILSGGEVQVIQMITENYLSEIGSTLVLNISKQGREDVAAGVLEEEIRLTYGNRLEEVERFYSLFNARVDLEEVTRKVYYPIYETYLSVDDLQAMLEYTRAPEANREVWVKTPTAIKFKRIEARFDRSRKLKLIEVLEPVAMSLLSELNLRQYYPTHGDRDFARAFAESLQ